MARGGITAGDGGAESLRVYLLGSVDFDAALRLQRRLHYEVSGDRHRAALLLCEHPPLITVGRQGSRALIRLDASELQSRRMAIRWVNRGGGCLLHAPGQLAIYPILPLDRLRLQAPAFVQKLGTVLRALLADFSVRGHVQVADSGVQVGGRFVAATGVAVHNWVSYFGAYLNVQPCLDSFRHVSWTVSHPEPMTSLERERRGKVRPAHVRERLIEHFAAEIGFDQVTAFSEHPSLEAAAMKRPLGASAAR